MKLQRRWLVVGTLATGFLGWWWLYPSDPTLAATPAVAGPGTASAVAQATVSSAGSDGARVPYSAAGVQSRQEQLVLWRTRHERAEQVYASYRDSTRYPFESRPISEHPDQVRPFAPKGVFPSVNAR